MATSTSLLVVLAFLAVSTGATDTKGGSSVCIRRWWQYILPWEFQSECCDVQKKCEVYIDPNSEKYGLRNDRSDWTVRLCTCDTALLKCFGRVNGRRSLNPSGLKSYFYNYFHNAKCLVYKSEKNKIAAVGSLEMIEYSDVFFRTNHPDYPFVRDVLLLVAGVEFGSAMEAVVPATMS